MNDNDKPQLGGCTGKGFLKGDHRINRSGRPKTFDELRRTADMIASELVPGPDGEMITRGELLLRNWLKSKNPILQRGFMEYWVGKVPDKIEAEGLQPKTRLILYYDHEERGPFDHLPPNLAREAQRRLTEKTATHALTNSGEG